MSKCILCGGAIGPGGDPFVCCSEEKASKYGRSVCRVKAKDCSDVSVIELRLCSKLDTTLNKVSLISFEIDHQMVEVAGHPGFYMNKQWGAVYYYGGHSSVYQAAKPFIAQVGNTGVNVTAAVYIPAGASAEDKDKLICDMRELIICRLRELANTASLCADKVSCCAIENV